MLMLSSPLRLTHHWQPLSRNSPLAHHCFCPLSKWLLSSSTAQHHCTRRYSNESEEETESKGYSPKETKRIITQFREREGILRQAAAEYGLEDDKQFKKALQRFLSSLSQRRRNLGSLEPTVRGIIEGTGHVDDLIPVFLRYASQLDPLLGPKQELVRTSNMALPPTWFPRARALSRRLVYHAGPTNSGKTYTAIQHFMNAESAIYCAPLRLLAHEIFHKSNKEGSPCDLLTGEESQFASGDQDRPATRLACTTEMAKLTVETPYEVAVIDEIQMLEDSARGGAWTRALLGLPAQQLHLCGHESGINIVRTLAESMGESLEVQHYERLSPLVPLKKSLCGEYRRVRPGDCVVTFSRGAVFHVRREIEKATKQRCAVIYGGLPPAVRVEQAEAFNNPGSKCNIMVATDAIGMGLNLNIGRIVFHSLSKYDGSEVVQLTPGHTKQIAGRAGRYGREHSHGQVTTLHQDDLPTLHELLDEPVEEIKRAGLYPSREQIELFANHLPNAKLHEILSVFYKMAKLNPNYFLCDIVDQIELAACLQDTSMSLGELFRFSLAPVPGLKPPIVRALITFAQAHSTTSTVSLKDLRKVLDSQAQGSEVKTMPGLAKLEEKHEIIDLYLWLSMRFPETFVSAEEARELQSEVGGQISKSIVQQRSHSYRKRLSEGEILAMADQSQRRGSGKSAGDLLSMVERLIRSNQLSPIELSRIRKKLKISAKKVKRIKNIEASSQMKTINNKKRRLKKNKQHRNIL